MASKRKSWREKLADSKDLPKIQKFAKAKNKSMPAGTYVIPSPTEVDAIMKKVLAWMDALAVIQRMVEVASGNEEVVAFYHRYGFYPRSVILRTVE